MISAPAAFTDRLAEAARAPIFAVELTSPHGGATYRFATAHPRNGGAFSTASLALAPENLEYGADPRECRFRVSELTFRLTDGDDRATRAVADGIEGYACAFFETARGLDWGAGDRITRFRGLVSEVRLQDGAYQVRARSAMAGALSKRLFDAAASRLHGSIDESQTRLLVADASGFGDAGTLLVGAERIDYARRTDNGNGTWLLSGLTRGAHGSAAAVHEVDARVQETFILGPDHPFDILETVLSSADEKTGLNMAAWVNSADLAAQKAAVGADYRMRFEVTRGDRGKDWLEREILRPMAVYPVEDSEGRMSVRRFDLPGAAGFGVTIGDAHAVGRPRWAGAFERQINSVTYAYDYAPPEAGHGAPVREFDGVFTRRNRPLIRLAGREHAYRIEAQGLSSGQASTAALLEARSQAYIDRFARPVGVISATVNMKHELLELGDPVYASFAEVVSLPAAIRSIRDAPHEVIGLRFDWGDGVIELELLGYPAYFSVPEQSFRAAPAHSATGVEVEVA